MKQRIEVLSQEAVPPLLIVESAGVLKQILMGSVTLPGVDEELEQVP